MPSNYDPEELDEEERAWHEQKMKAAARRNTSRQQSPSLTPPALTEKEYDEMRKAQALADQEKVRASAVTPGSLQGGGDPFDLDLSITVPNADLGNAISPASPQPTQNNVKPNSQPAVTAISELTVWTCRVSIDGHEEALYAASWDDLKVRLAKHEGLWQATEHKFQNTPANILGFFVPTQHVFPKNTEVTQFEIIVKNGKVFKAES